MIVVTGATGKLGSLVVEGLLSKGLGGDTAVAVRTPEKAKALALRGIEVRHADYDDAQSLDGAFRVGDKVLFVSSSELGVRAEQHKAVVEAAERAGVALLAYTSILHGERNTMQMAADHIATEEEIRASRLPFVFLRNGWYVENYMEHALGPALDHGAFLGCASNGKIAAASRADYAAAAVAVLTETGHEGNAYELGADSSFTMSDLAAEVTRQSGKFVAYKDLPLDEYRAALVRIGVPSQLAKVLSDSDAGIARGELNDTSRTLRNLIGRSTTTLEQAVTAGLALMSVD